MRLLLPALLLVAVATPAAAQMEAVAPDLALTPPGLAGEAEDGIEPGATALVSVPWTLTFATPAAAAAELAQGEATLTIGMLCNVPLTAPAVATAIEHVPGQVEYGGTTELSADATAVRGYTKAECTATGTFEGATSSSSAQSSATLPIVYRAALNVTAGVASRQAGPQKQIAFPLDVRNDGDARVHVRFELAGKEPGGKWAVLLPDAIVLEPDQTIVSIVTVATPFENGYNKGTTDFTVRAVPSPVDEDDVRGGPVDVPLHAGVDGFYIPGPSPALPFVALAAVAALLARRAA